MIEDRRRYSEETEMHRSNGRSSGGERLFIEQIAAESLKEQRIARRWGVFFKCLAFGYIGFGLLLAGRNGLFNLCLLYTSPSPRDRQKSRMPSSA